MRATARRVNVGTLKAKRSDIVRSPRRPAEVLLCRRTILMATAQREKADDRFVNSSQGGGGRSNSVLNAFVKQIANGTAVKMQHASIGVKANPNTKRLPRRIAGFHPMFLLPTVAGKPCKLECLPTFSGRRLLLPLSCRYGRVQTCSFPIR